MADRVTSDDLIKSCRGCTSLANMNMIRIWGGGYYGSCTLMIYAMKKESLSGRILGLPALMYPLRKDFLENVKAEIAYNVKKN